MTDLGLLQNVPQQQDNRTMKEKLEKRRAYLATTVSNYRDEIDKIDTALERFEKQPWLNSFIQEIRRIVG